MDAELEQQRTRSPNYPAISLPDAIEKLKSLFNAIHSHPAPRDVVAKGIGYNTLNGASATAISALQKYGLLDRAGDDLRISARGMTILHPHEPGEREEAIRAAAAEPKLFAELRERFPGRLPNEDLLRNYLVRKGFSRSALSLAILAYRETLKLVEEEAGGYDAPSNRSREMAPMEHQYGAGGASAPATPSRDPRIMAGSAAASEAPFEIGFTGSAIRISGSLVTREAVETVVNALSSLKGFLPTERPPTPAQGIPASSSKPQPAGPASGSSEWEGMVQEDRDEDMFS